MARQRSGCRSASAGEQYSPLRCTFSTGCGCLRPRRP